MLFVERDATLKNVHVVVSADGGAGRTDELRRRPAFFVRRVGDPALLGRGAAGLHASSLFSDAVSVRPTHGLVARAIVIIIAALLVGRAPAVLALAAPVWKSKFYGAF